MCKEKKKEQIGKDVVRKKERKKEMGGGNVLRKKERKKERKKLIE